MLWGEAVLIDSFDMSAGAVTDVFIETVVGVFVGKVYHIVVAGDFGDDGSGGDGANFAVGFDESGGV